MIDIEKLPLVFDVPIIDYSNQKVYCKGMFRKPTQDEIKKHSKEPFAIFQPAEPHGWCVSFYSQDAVAAMIERARPI